MASASHDEELVPENTSGYVLSQPKQSLAEYQQMDAGDESLQRYKESLGLLGGKDLSDPNDPRVCIILSLTMDSPGRPPVTIDLSQPGSEATLKEKPFRIKEDSKFAMTVTFKVQHEILTGLHYVQTIKRKGIPIPPKLDEMIGSFAPNTDKNPIYKKTFQDETAPSGFLFRGKYDATSCFIDDDKKTHLKFEWSFEIAKEW
ncbi:Rho GDP-dissociation inhibitor-like protein [Diplogelasinospora grovesii]|uniref:Rho GDP-dissociation inhibitor-like protein n=1 Tax=Diplogelasinospora grovesii TaxID=303347 RepID=A0AAN6NFQ6_9PEZI|nr:Rho GDP-dissociation inhibitor-like protein [Diplogelasinospora grovesii]